MNEDEILITGMEAGFCLKNSSNYHISFNTSKQKTAIWNGQITINSLLAVSLSWDKKGNEKINHLKYSIGGLYTIFP